uniref:hypothetical protein n=1 Tax=Staphylococcus epidermidis TaxID=1282 RepID=UPI001C92E0DB
PQPLINNPHPTPKQISHHKSKLQQPLPHFNHPKHQLTPHTTQLQTPLQQLNRRRHTNNKNPTTINPYNKPIQSLQTQITSSKHN